VVIMNALLLLAAVLPAIALGLGAPDARIVGGQDVDIADYPFQVRDR
jgi:secreted trypsin-like serine protease